MSSGQSRSSAPLGGLILLVVLLGAGFVFHWLPKWRAERMFSNEKNAVATICSFPAFHEEFRRKDLDRNGVSDYWTGDVAGLFQYGLIDRSLAEADASPLVPRCPRPIPWNGYYCVALKVEEPANAAGDVTPDKSSPFPPKEWAVCLYPEEPGRTGMYMYITSSVTGRMRTPATRPPPKSWPSDAELRTWSKWD